MNFDDYISPTPAPFPWVDRWFDDLDVHVRMRCNGEAEISVDYEVRDMVEETYAAKSKHVLFTVNGPRTSDNADEIPPILTGFIKWDGHSEHDFEDSFHGGSRDDMTKLGVLFDRLFDLAIELIGHEDTLGKKSKG